MRLGDLGGALKQFGETLGTMADEQKKENFRSFTRWLLETKMDPSFNPTSQEVMQEAKRFGMGPEELGMATQIVQAFQQYSRGEQERATLEEFRGRAIPQEGQLARLGEGAGLRTFGDIEQFAKAAPGVLPHLIPQQKVPKTVELKAWDEEGNPIPYYVPEELAPQMAGALKERGLSLFDPVERQLKEEQAGRAARGEQRQIAEAGRSAERLGIQRRAEEERKVKELTQRLDLNIRRVLDKYGKKADINIFAIRDPKQMEEAMQTSYAIMDQEAKKKNPQAQLDKKNVDNWMRRLQGTIPPEEGISPTTPSADTFDWQQYRP